MNIHRKILVVITFIVAFAGCGKYEDGPKFSPWPKKWRLDGTWKLDQVVVGSVTQSMSINETWQYKGNGDYIYTIGSTSFNGSWQFTDSKESISTTLGGITTTQKILQLTMKELWLQPNSSEEDHYVPN